MLETLGGRLIVHCIIGMNDDGDEIDTRMRDEAAEGVRQHGLPAETRVLLRQAAMITRPRAAAGRNDERSGCHVSPRACDEF